MAPERAINHGSDIGDGATAELGWLLVRTARSRE